ncbi:hypothetical protein, partial [Aquabacterium sp.]|uniref:hypothetical protein n=1 Tax=Aquabacterium sp. TaxID=1872578 RepID=UPI003785296D
MRKSLASGLLLAGVLVSGAASAAPWTWSGTLADWGAAGGGTGVITDGDGDVSFTLFNTTTIPDGVNGYVTISEVEIGGADYYDVGLSWDASTGFAGGYAGGGQLVYAMDVLAPSTERIVAAALDSAITGTGTTALAVLRDLPAN